MITGGDVASGSGNIVKKESAAVSSSVVVRTNGAPEARNMEQPSLEVVRIPCLKCANMFFLTNNNETKRI